jgi:hypothetical protein
MTGKLDWLFEIQELTPRRHGQIMNQIMHERAAHHGSKRMQRHFNRNQWTSPGGPYRYRARSNRNIERKKRKGVDPYRPNVFTGDLYRMVMSTGKPTATQKHWTWRARGTKKRPIPEWQKQELEAIAPDERREDVSAIAKRYIQEANRPENKRVRRRRIKG